MNLVETWIDIELAVPYRTLSDALRDLRMATGTRSDLSHLGKWRRGERTPRPAVQRYMAEVIAPTLVERVLTALGDPTRRVLDVPDADLDEIAECICPPRHRARPD